MSDATTQADELSDELRDLRDSAEAAQVHAENVAIMLGGQSLTQSEKDEALRDLDATRTALNGPKSLTDIEAMIGQLSDAVRLYPLEEEDDPQ